jgi:hypothetical protein
MQLRGLGFSRRGAPEGKGAVRRDDVRMHCCRGRPGDASVVERRARGRVTPEAPRGQPPAPWSRHQHYLLVAAAAWQDEASVECNTGGRRSTAVTSAVGVVLVRAGAAQCSSAV